MKHILFFLFGLCLTFMACSSGKKLHSSVPKQGISGKLLFASGNHMPMVGAPPNDPQPLKGTILVYEPTNLSQVTRMGDAPEYTAIHTRQIASVETDSSGTFSIALPPGAYSLFVKRNDHYYANLFDNNNNIALYTVEEGKLTTVKITVSTTAVY